MNTPYDGDAVAVVGAIAAMAQILRLDTVGEGVENGRQLEMLRELRCSEVQGNYVSKPLPAADVPALVHASLMPLMVADLFSQQKQIICDSQRSPNAR